MYFENVLFCLLYYVFFISQDEYVLDEAGYPELEETKHYMLVWNTMEIKSEIKKRLLPKTSYGDKTMVWKDVRYLTLEQAKIYDITLKINQHAPELIDNINA